MNEKAFIIILILVALSGWSVASVSLTQMSELTNTFNSEIAEASEEWYSLYTTYQEYKALHTHNDSDYDELVNILSTFSDDKLNVTSELDRYLRWGYDRYELEVAVTNIGSQSIASGWLFVFTCIDGKLEPYLIHDMSLPIGETFHKTFTWHALSNQTVSYKIFAVGGG